MNRLLLLLFLSCSFISFAQPCDSTQIRLDTNWVGPGPQTGQIDFTCLDSSITLNFADHIQCSSVNPNGDNFFVLLPNGDTINAIQTLTGPNGCTNDSTMSILVKFERPLSDNGIYYLVVHPDQWGQPIQNVCGAQWWSDSIILNVQGCYLAQFSLDQITQPQNQQLELHFSKDTTSFPSYLFDQYNIYRKTPLDNDFILVGNETQLNTTTYLDQSLPTGFIGFAQYYMALQINQTEVVLSDTLAYYLVLSREEFNTQNEILFQNPFDNFLSINSQQVHSVKVIDVSGRMVYKTQIQVGENLLNLSHLNNGIYFMIVDEDLKQTFKILKN